MRDIKPKTPNTTTDHVHRIKELESRLAASERRSAELDAKLVETKNDLERAVDLMAAYVEEAQDAAAELNKMRQEALPMRNDAIEKALDVALAELRRRWSYTGPQMFSPPPPARDFDAERRLWGMVSRLRRELSGDDAHEGMEVSVRPIGDSKTAVVQEWRLDGEFHRDDGPAIISPVEWFWYRAGTFHRQGGPAYCGWCGDVVTFVWAENGNIIRRQHINKQTGRCDLGKVWKLPEPGSWDPPTRFTRKRGGTA